MVMGGEWAQKDAHRAPCALTLPSDRSKQRTPWNPLENALEDLPRSGSLQTTLSHT